MRVVHNLMYAMGNQEYADSQRQSSISLEVCKPEQNLTHLKDFFLENQSKMEKIVVFEEFRWFARLRSIWGFRAPHSTIFGDVPEAGLNA